MTTIEVLEVYILSHIDYDAKEIGFVGHAHAKGVGYPHPGTAMHPNYFGTLDTIQVFYMVDNSEFIIWSCEAMVVSNDSGLGLLMTYKNFGYNIKQVSVQELKRRNALYRQSTREDQ